VARVLITERILSWQTAYLGEMVGRQYDWERGATRIPKNFKKIFY